MRVQTDRCVYVLMLQGYLGISRSIFRVPVLPSTEFISITPRAPRCADRCAATYASAGQRHGRSLPLQHAGGTRNGHGKQTQRKTMPPAPRVMRWGRTCSCCYLSNDCCALRAVARFFACPMHSTAVSRLASYAQVDTFPPSPLWTDVVDAILVLKHNVRCHR